MKINPRMETESPLLSSAISRDKLQTDFQSSLDTARQQLAKNRRQAAAQPDAMQEAMAEARKALEDYIKKGPIGHLRDRILEQLGLTEEDIAKMSPEQREAVEKTIAAQMKEILLAGFGMNTTGIQAQLMDMPPPLTNSIKAAASE